MVFQNRNILSYGTTLIEVIMSIVVVSVLFTVVAPNWSEMLVKHRIIAGINNLSTAIRFGRFDAIEYQHNTLLCPSADYKKCDLNNWSLPKIVFADLNHNNHRDDNEALIHQVSQPHKGTWIKGPRRAIQFFGGGMVASPVTLFVCPEKPNEKLNRAVVVSLQGRVRIRKGKYAQCI